MSWVVQLDPSAVATGRTPLDLNVDPIRVDQRGVDFGESALTQYMAQQSKYGSAPADFVVPNRTVTIPLFLGTGGYATTADQIAAEEAARSQLQQKVARLQTEGGWLLRQRAGGPAMYADVVDAQVTIPDVWGETGGVEPDVVLVLVCLPDFYGDEVTLDSASATGVCTGVLQQSGVDAVIEGDYPARARIIVTDTSGNDQKSLLWGIRSKHYDSADSAALFYEAEKLTGVNGAAAQPISGESGSSTMYISSLPAASWVSMLSTELSAAFYGTAQQMTHQGSYRVWARCYSTTGTPQFRLQWGVGSLSVPVTNDPVALPGKNAFYLLDLGEIRLDMPPVGAGEWFGVVQAYSTNGGDSAAIDCLYFQPLDDGAGQLTYVSEPPASSVSASGSPTTGADNAGTGTITWSSPGNIGTQDGAEATATLTPSASSHYLEASAFGFAIPAGATIQGILVQIARFGNSFGAVEDLTVELMKAGSLVGSNRAVPSAWPTALATASYGGSADLWATSWAASDINGSGFGVALSVTNLVSRVVEALVDWIGVTVYYTLASGFTVAQDAVVYADGICEARHDGMFRQGPGAGPYGPVSQVVGDLVRLPPSGIEGRPVQLFIKPTRGDGNALPDNGLDGFSAEAKYRPSWISRP